MGDTGILTEIRQNPDFHQRVSLPRHLIALSIMVMALTAAAFGWLSWRVIEQDRALERQRLVERLDADAAAAANSLQRVLLDILEQIAAGKAQPDADGVLVSFTSTELTAVPRGRIAYSPAPPLAPEPPLEPFEVADSLETTAPERSLNALAFLARSEETTVRAGALVRIARIQRKANRFAKALRAYDELSAIDGVSIGGEPVSLAAREARCQVLSHMGDREGLEREKARLRREFESGHWILSKAVYRLYSRLLHTSDANAEAMAEAVENVWKERVAAREVQGWSRISNFWIGNDVFFSFNNTNANVTTALVARPLFLERRWHGTLTDDTGRLLLGTLKNTTDAAHVPVAAGLHWTVHVHTSGDPTVSTALARRRGFIIGGLGIIGFFAAAGSYFIARGLAREFAFARLQADFVSAVSHEFRTPLTTIRQLTELLKKGRVASDAKRDEYYDLLAKESERLHRLVEDLLDFRRMEADAVEFRFEPLDPAGLLRGVVADFRENGGAHGYAIELAANGDVAPIRGDRESLRRAIWNLLENAVKYSPECRTVWVDLAEGPKQVEIRIRDRGIGIPVSEQQTVFEKFVRGREAKSASIPGTGLGLAMVRHIVQSHEGRVELSSRPGEGSTFTMVLPTME